MRAVVAVTDAEARRMLAGIASFEGGPLIVGHIRSGFVTMLRDRRSDELIFRLAIHGDQSPYYLFDRETGEVRGLSTIDVPGI